jgi:hypothetical protein
MPLADVDALFDAVIETLPASQQAAARGLPHRLKLAPSPDIPWSAVFNHEVTLGAPALFAQAMPEVNPGFVRDAVIAHMLAVIEAFGLDRIHDRQIEADADLRELLSGLRIVRNRAAARLSADAPRDFRMADAEFWEAMQAERPLLEQAEACTFTKYVAVSLAKQSVGFPATIALAQKAGWPAVRLKALRGALEGVWLGLQFYDDALDWEDDWRNGGAWAVCLARGIRAASETKERPTRPDALARFVSESGVLPRLLRFSRRRFHAARLRAQALGATRLAAWALVHERRVAGLAHLEAEHEGFTARMQKLGAWKELVLR